MNVTYLALIIAVTVGLAVVGILVALVNRWAERLVPERSSLGDITLTRIIIAIAEEGGISLVEAWHLWQTQYSPRGCYRMVEL